jgi:hypothetical protein
LVSYKSIEKVSIVSTSPFQFTKVSARRWLQLTAAACLTALLVACGGGSGSGGSAAIASVDAGAADNQPWKAVFNGASSLSFNATGCSGSVGSTETAVFTLTRGTNTFVASITSGTLTVGPFTVGDNSVFWSYSLLVGTGTSTSVDLYASISNREFGLSNSNGQSQNVYLNDNLAESSISCAQVTNPLTRAQLGLQPQARLASFLAGSPTNVVTSADVAPTGCNLSSGIGTHTYAISAQGVVQFDQQTLAANWLDTLNDARAFYYESAGGYATDYQYSDIVLAVSGGRSVRLSRFFDGESSSFSHRCGSSF